MFGFISHLSRNAHEKAPITPSVIPSAKTCLVIDDSPLILDLFKTIVESLNVEAKYAEDERLGLQIVPVFAPALIFLDIRLRSSDGIDVMMALAQMRYRGVVQLMSGRYKEYLDQVTDAGSRLGLHMRPPLQKPFSPAQIRNIIREERLVTEALSTQRFPFRKAWDEGMIEIWFQPQIDMITRTVYGAQAVVRARHPTYGLSAPSAFLADATLEDRLALTRLAIAEACSFWGTMREHGFNLAISIGATSEILEDPSIRIAVDRCAPRHVDFPGLLFELGSADLFRDVARTNRLMVQMGLYRSKLVAGDFLLRDADSLRLLSGSLRQIKISESLVSGLKRDKLPWNFVRNLRDYAERTECRLCADGVETQDQVDALVQCNITCGQGVFYSQSLEKEKFLNALKSRVRTVDSHPAPNGRDYVRSIIEKSKKHKMD